MTGAVIGRARGCNRPSFGILYVSMQTNEAVAACSSSQDAHSLFECGVCMDTASDPVITFCGHLYCWSCIYRWMKVREDEGALCPICKLRISEERMIPLYGRGRPMVDSNRSAEAQLDVTLIHRRRSLPPPRPRAWGSDAGAAGDAAAVAPDSAAFADVTASSTSSGGSASAHTDDSGGASGRTQGAQALSRLLASFVASSPSLPSASTAQDAAVGSLSPEQIQQAFLSRVLLLLGSFVILCLLLI